MAELEQEKGEKRENNSFFIALFSPGSPVFT
jgi:hypothetical protein